MIEGIKEDREVGVRSIYWADMLYSDFECKCDRCNADARRIARVPELEDYCLEAQELLKIVLAGECVNYCYIAPRHIERIKKLVGEA